MHSIIISTSNSIILLTKLLGNVENNWMFMWCRYYYGS